MSISKVKLCLLVFVSLLEISLFGGIQLGWSSILYILKAEGFYQDLCSNTTFNIDLLNTSTPNGAVASNSCFSQDKQLHLLYSISLALFSILGVISGEMLYKLGTKTTRIIFM